MNILIVDDQKIVLDGIQRNIDWAMVPNVDDVFYSINSLEALSIIHHNTIDILITDIEMPGDDGLTLIQKALSYKNDLLCILLTSHASFQYAKEALSLGCFDYILQPVEYEVLQDSVEKAIRALLSMKEKDNLNSIFLNTQKKENLYNLFMQFCHSELSAETLVKQAAINELYLSLQETYIIVIRQMISYSLSIENQLSTLNSNIMMELSATNNAMYTCLHIFELDSFHSLLLFQCANKEESDVSANHLYSSLSFISDKLLKQQQIFLAFYLSAPCGLKEIPDQFLALKEAENQNLTGFSSVFSSHISNFEQGKNSPVGKNWIEQIGQGNIQYVIDEITDYLNIKMKKGTLTGNTLISIQQKFVHALYGAFDLRNIPLDTLFKNEIYLQSYIKALKTPEYLIHFVEYSCGLYGQLTDMISLKPELIIEKIKLYIDQNLDSTLSRKIIAEHFFISEDYLSHLFKKETGHPLSDYITNMRMNRAKFLLSSTNLSISMISVKVGFNDFSYFSKTFKSITNMTPAEYRKNNIYSE